MTDRNELFARMLREWENCHMMTFDPDSVHPKDQDFLDLWRANAPADLAGYTEFLNAFDEYAESHIRPGYK